MARTIYFQKEENNNVTIREVSTGKIIYALLPTQNITKDIANAEAIIIKSAISSFDDRGIVIKCSDIDNWSCIPVIYSYGEGGTKGTNALSVDSYITALMRDFFFEVASQIQYVDGVAFLPSTGDTKTIYITLDTHQQYYWEGFAYFPYNGSVTNFENVLLSDTEFKKTFWLDFPVESNPIDLTKQKIDIVFPDVDIQAEISVCLQADLFVSGSITKEYSISKSTASIDFISNNSHNGILTSNQIVSAFAMGNMDIVGRGRGNMYFTVANNNATTAKRVKVEVLYKSRVKNYTSSGESLCKYIFDNLTPSALYLSSLYVPINNETKPSLPLDYFPLALNNVMINPLTKELKESVPFTSTLRISKEIDFKDNLYSYIGSKAGDFLDVPDTNSKLLSQIVPSNNLITFNNGGILKSVRIISNDYNVEIKLYLFSISQFITSNGLQTTIRTPRVVLDCGSGIASYSFALNPARNVGAGEILMLTVKSKIDTPRKVILEGAITFLNL